MSRIFLIEDDDKLNSHIKEFLEMYHFQVDTVNNFKEVEKEFESANPDLVLLDINLPYCDGFYLCRVFRKTSSLPIIIISARTGDMEQIMGIELGADDYVTKPFNLQLLLAKIKACLRRVNLQEKVEDFHVNGLKLDQNSFKIYFKDKEVELSKNEFKLLKKLIENKGIIVERGDLLELIWDDSQFVDDNTLTVNVTRVKNKLKELQIENVIKTKRGVGYVFEW